MSNVLHGAGFTYFQAPQQFVDAGLLKKLTPAAVRFYLALLYKAQRHTRVDFNLTNAEIGELTGLSSNSIRSARNELCENKLLSSSRGRGGVYTDVLCDPASGQPIVRSKQATNNATSETPSTGRTEKSPESGEAQVNFFDQLTNRDFTLYFAHRLPSWKPRTKLTTCPFHADHNASLSVDAENGIWCCHGCRKSGGVLDFELEHGGGKKREAVARIADIVGKADILRNAAGRKVEDIYPYVDEDGKLLWQVLRYPGKKFKQRRWIKDKWVNNVSRSQILVISIIALPF